MFQAALVAALAITLVQGTESPVGGSKSITERANELREEYVREVRDKSTSESSRAKDETRRQSVATEGFLLTVWGDVKYTVLTPIYWMINVLLLPIHFVQNIYYAYTLKDEKQM